MKFKFLLNRTDNVFAENRLLKFSLMVLLIGFFGQGIMTYAAVRYKTVVIIPPNLTQEVEITNGIPSDEYVKAVVRDINFLAFEYTPAVARSNFNELLSYYGPTEYPSASTRWYNLADRIETSRISSTMPIEGIEIDPAKNKVWVSGTRTLYTDNQIAEQKKKVFTFNYKIVRGRFNLIAIEEGRK